MTRKINVRQTLCLNLTFEKVIISQYHDHTWIFSRLFTSFRSAINQGLSGFVIAIIIWITMPTWAFQIRNISTKIYTCAKSKGHSLLNQNGHFILSFRIYCFKIGMLQSCKISRLRSKWKKWGEDFLLPSATCSTARFFQSKCQF